jgi:aspartate carbamoyltransferase regulatory subunit
MNPAVKVTCISSIENIERFIQCANSNCRKKIKQDSGKSVVKCDLCGHTMTVRKISLSA